MKVIIDLGCAGGGNKWSESYAGRGEELGLSDSERSSPSLLAKALTISVPSRMQNK